MSAFRAPSRAVFAVPAEGADLTVDLPGERVRAVVVKRIEDDALLVELSGAPMTRGHSYRKGMRIPVRLEQSALGQAVWSAMPDSEFLLWQMEQRQAAAAKRKRA